MLGLRNLIHFITERVANSSYVYKIASDKTSWYFFCASGINFTGQIIKLIEENHLDDILLNYNQDSINITHELYDLLFTNFNKLWVDKKINNFMQFNTLLEEFIATKAIGLINNKNFLKENKKSFY
jgi:hypothetical protein